MSFLHFFLPFDGPFDAGLFAFAAGLAFGLPGFWADAFRSGAPSSVISAVGVAVAACGAAAARLARGCACLLGFLPSVSISVMRRSVNSWRWPILRREFLRRRFLKAMILGPRACSRTSAATVAPATVGTPSDRLS